MKINYFKQAWISMKQQPVVSAVSVAGTALAIFLIMIVVMMSEVHTAPFPPESNRDRWLVQKFMSITYKDWGEEDSSNGAMGTRTIKAVFDEMKQPEAVAVFNTYPLDASLSAPNTAAYKAEVRGVNTGFWKVMDFTFVSGKPFTQADFDSELPVAVINETVARKLFGSIDVIGREFLINHAPYRVVGVVKDVSNLADLAYAELWVPYNTQTMNTWCDDYLGMLSAAILAKSPSDFPKIREEYNQLFAKLGDEAGTAGWKFIQRERPYTQEVHAATPWANNDPDMESARNDRLIIYLILLIVPAVNLSSMTHSRLRRRREEIGVRRAFGARRSGIIVDIFVENLIITIIAGLIGLALSLAFALFWGNSIFNPGYGSTLESTGINMTMLFHWSTFGWAIIFCFILNLLSAGLPSWNAARVNIVNAINGKQ